MRAGRFNCTSCQYILHCLYDDSLPPQAHESERLISAEDAGEGKSTARAPSGSEGSPTTEHGYVEGTGHEVRVDGFCGGEDTSMTLLLDGPLRASQVCDSHDSYDMSDGKERVASSQSHMQAPSSKSSASKTLSPASLLLPYPPSPGGGRASPESFFLDDSHTLQRALDEIPAHQGSILGEDQDTSLKQRATRGSWVESHAHTQQPKQQQDLQNASKQRTRRGSWVEGYVHMQQTKQRQDLQNVSSETGGTRRVREVSLLSEEAEQYQDVNHPSVLEIRAAGGRGGGRSNDEISGSPKASGRWPMRNVSPIARARRRSLLHADLEHGSRPVKHVAEVWGWDAAGAPEHGAFPKRVSHGWSRSSSPVPQARVGNSAGASDLGGLSVQSSPSSSRAFSTKAQARGDNAAPLEHDGSQRSPAHISRSSSPVVKDSSRYAALWPSHFDGVAELRDSASPKAKHRVSAELYSSSLDRGSPLGPASQSLRAVHVGTYSHDAGRVGGSAFGDRGSPSSLARSKDARVHVQGGHDQQGRTEGGIDRGRSSSPMMQFWDARASHHHVGTNISDSPQAKDRPQSQFSSPLHAGEGQKRPVSPMPRGRGPNQVKEADGLLEHFTSTDEQDVGERQKPLLSRQFSSFQRVPFSSSTASGGATR